MKSSQDSYLSCINHFSSLQDGQHPGYKKLRFSFKNDFTLTGRKDDIRPITALKFVIHKLKIARLLINSPTTVFIGDALKSGYNDFSIETNENLCSKRACADHASRFLSAKLHPTHFELTFAPDTRDEYISELRSFLKSIGLQEQNIPQARPSNATMAKL